MKLLEQPHLYLREQIRDELEQWINVARAALEDGENLRIRLPVQWVLDWFDAGALLGEPLELLAERVTQQSLDDLDLKVWPVGKPYVKQRDRESNLQMDQSTGSDIDLPVPHPEVITIDFDMPSYSDEDSPGSDSVVILPTPRRSERLAGNDPQSAIAVSDSPVPFPAPRQPKTLPAKPKQTGARHTGGIAPRKTFGSHDVEDSRQDDLSSEVRELVIAQAEPAVAPEDTDTSNLVCYCYRSLSLTQLIMCFVYSGA